MLPIQGDDDNRRMSARDRLPDQARDRLRGVTGCIRLTFVAPLAAGALPRAVMQGFAGSTGPRWKGFDRMLEHVHHRWRNQPRHHDPVFERDGFRCSTLACSSFTNLHDHECIVAGRKAKVARGVTDFTVMFGDPGLGETLELFAREVMPAFE